MTTTTTTIDPTLAELFDCLDVAPHEWETLRNLISDRMKELAGETGDPNQEIRNYMVTEMPHGLELANRIYIDYFLSPN